MKKEERKILSLAVKLLERRFSLEQGLGANCPNIFINGAKKLLSDAEKEWNGLDISEEEKDKFISLAQVKMLNNEADLFYCSKKRAKTLELLKKYGKKEGIVLPEKLGIELLVTEDNVKLHKERFKKLGQKFNLPKEKKRSMLGFYQKKVGAEPVDAYTLFDLTDYYFKIKKGPLELE